MQSYSIFKVIRKKLDEGGLVGGGGKRYSSREEIPHIQGKRNPSKTAGVARGHQRADTLPSDTYLQKIYSI